MAFTLEQTRRLAEIRDRSIKGIVTLEELKEGFQIMRQDRVAASTGSTASRAKKAADKAPINTAALLDQLRGQTFTE